jgi:drug/metabolite transporter (DMT)-like permease
MNFRITLALLITMVLWSSAFAAIRGALENGYDAISLALVRFGVASLVMAAYAAVTRMRMPARRDLPAILLVGVLGVSIYHVLLNLGERTVSSGAAAFLINTVPVFAALIARFYLKERLSAWGWIGIAVSFTGVLLTSMGRERGLALDANALLIVGSALSSAIYLVIHKPYLARYSAAQFSTYMIWAGTLALLALFLVTPGSTLRTANAHGTLLVIYLGVFPAAIAYFTWTYVVSKFPVSRAVTFLYLIPPLAVLFGWIWRHEQLGPLTLAGGALSLGGVIIVNRLGKYEPAGSQPAAAKAWDAPLAHSQVHRGEK